jgi:hypothetical protein
MYGERGNVATIGVDVRLLPSVNGARKRIYNNERSGMYISGECVLAAVGLKKKQQKQW